MKKITLSILIICLGLSLLAQAPKAFKYQAVVRDNTGDPIAGQLVSIRVGIVQDSINGTLVYSEIHSGTTNQFGMIGLDVGKGTIETGVFGDINWGATFHFLQLELDQTGGVNYQPVGTTQLLSVPYSINAGSLTLTSPDGVNYEVTVDDDGALITNCTPMPTVANAGPDQVNTSSFVILEANTPVHGSGLWDIISGTGGNISDPSDPASTFSGIADNSYTLRWTISTVCDSNYDDVSIGFIALGQPCPGIPSFEYDGQIYNTVQIGTQCWMAENLNIGTMINGSENQTNNGTIEKYCYANITSNCDAYGGLYQWNEMMLYVTAPGISGICPYGWHLPTDEEWCTMENEVDAGTVSCTATDFRGIDAGLNLKSTSGWYQGGNGVDLYGFTVLPGGHRHTSGVFSQLTAGGYFWMSSEYSSSGAWTRLMGSWSNSISRYSSSYGYGYSVRCLKNYIPNQPPLQPSNPSPDNGAIDQQINTTLSWTCADPENDPLTYDVYFGETNPPVLVSSGQTANTYDPGILNFETTYYWKITAHDDHANSTESPVWNFTTEAQSFLLCGDDLIDSRDGLYYTTVQIGSQCWMAENLNIGTMIIGDSNQTNNDIIEKYCFSNNNYNDCSSLGGLYQWDEMMQYNTTPGVQGICPPDWHVPTDGEWCILENEVDIVTVECDINGWRGHEAGGNLKSTRTEPDPPPRWEIPNTGATNSSGFTGLGGGRRDGGGGIYNNLFDFKGDFGYFWTSSIDSPNTVLYHSLSNQGKVVGRENTEKTSGYSVRCLKN